MIEIYGNIEYYLFVPHCYLNTLWIILSIIHFNQISIFLSKW